MPNHVANRISGPSLQLIRDLLRGDDSAVDFCRLIPRPAGLEVEAHCGVIDAAKVACNDWPNPEDDRVGGLLARLQTVNMQKQESPLKFSDKDWEHFIQCLQNRRRYGHYTWYAWSIEHWGTKWNAYAVEDRGDSLYFETAWSHPGPVMRALAVKLPTGAEFTWEFADEDFGNNLGRWTFSTGVLRLAGLDPDKCDEILTLSASSAEEWAMRMHGYDDERIAEYRAECDS